MAAATDATSLVPVQPAFTDAERLALAWFLAGYRGLTREVAPQPRSKTAWPSSAARLTVPQAPRERSPDVATGSDREPPLCAMLAHSGNMLAAHIRHFLNSGRPGVPALPEKRPRPSARSALFMITVKTHAYGPHFYHEKNSFRDHGGGGETVWWGRR
jgi:hypothetical protein